MKNGKVILNTSWCKGCGICVEYCPKNILKLEQNVISIEDQDLDIDLDLDINTNNTSDTSKDINLDSDINTKKVIGLKYTDEKFLGLFFTPPNI